MSSWNTIFVRENSMIIVDNRIVYILKNDIK